MTARRHLLLLPLLFILTPGVGGSAAARGATAVDEGEPSPSVRSATRIFYTLNRQNGLSDNGILQMIQLGDGRMAVYTERGVNVYNGQNFCLVPLHKGLRTPLRRYDGETHLYLDRQERLWIKDHYAVTCVDLQRLRPMPAPLDSLRRWGGGLQPEDLYIDSQHDTWVVVGRRLRNIRTRRDYLMPDSLGRLQDLDVWDGRLYTFFSTGMAVDYDLRTGRRLRVATAYGPADARLYQRTSLIVRGPHRMFYQIRTSRHETIFLAFDTRRFRFRELYRSPYILNTLNVTPDNVALICSLRGYLLFDLNRGARCREFRTVSLPDGSTLTDGINTIYPDHQQGVWLGTYHNGLLYASSLFNLFDTRTLNIPVCPILTNVYLGGEELRMGRAYGGRVLLPTDTPYLQQLLLGSGQRDVSFKFTTMNYVRPRGTCYRYRFDGGVWHTVSADSHPDVVSDHGVMYLSFTRLAAGDHTLQVQASTNPRRWVGTVRTVHISVARPWWAWPGVWAGAVVLAGGVGAGWLLRRRRKEAAAGTESPVLSPQRPQAEPMAALFRPLSPVSEAPAEPTADVAAAQPDFLQRAEALVRRHLADGEYGVEQLANDLCVERTGLYKKLTALTADTPVAFIRNIRLDEAARMLRQGRHGVNEIAAQCGFNSPSYFAKCFKLKFGMKPSEYQ